MKWYPWLTKPYKDLVAQYTSDRSHHALLLHIPEQFGEELLVNALGRWLMCLHPQGEKTCGQCRGCQLMSAGTHPDWYEVIPENNKSTLGVEQIRQLTDKIYERSQQGGVKAVWLPDATLLTDSAANALLKTLEEPPENTYFLLGCHEPAKLLATIRSRCLYWPLLCPNESYGSQWLAREYPQVDKQNLITALRLSNLSPLKAYNLLDAKYWQQRLDLANAFSSAVHQKDFLSLLPELNQDNAPERLNWCLSLFTDAMKRRQNAGDYIANQDQLLLIERLAGTFDSLALQKIIRQWLSCRRQLMTIAGVNKELLLTNLLVNTEKSCFI